MDLRVEWIEEWLERRQAPSGDAERITGGESAGVRFLEEEGAWNTGAQSHEEQLTKAGV